MAIADENQTIEAQPVEPEAAAKTRAQWLQDRRSGIGASEAAAALGESPFKSPWELYAEKTGSIEPPDLSDKLYVRLGQVMERGVGEIWAEQTGREIEFWPQTEVLRHADRPHVLCTPDAFQFHPDRGRGSVSIKTTDERFLKDWERDGIPLAYQIQNQQELAITGLQWGTLAVAFGRRTLKSFEYDRNDRFIAVLLAKLDDFWRMIETKTPPAIDWTEGCGRALAALYPQDSGETVQLPAEAEEWDATLVAAKERIKEAEKTAAECENRLKAAIGIATFGRFQNGGGYSWKQQTRKAHEVKESTFRVLRRLSK